MMAVTELQAWLNTLDASDMVGIDAGGLALKSIKDDKAYIEVGGMPDDDEDS